MHIERQAKQITKAVMDLMVHVDNVNNAIHNSEDTGHDVPLQVKASFMALGVATKALLNAVSGEDES